MKFKKGDKVIVKRFEKRPFSWNSDGLMDHLMGKVVTIEDAHSTGSYWIYDCVNKRYWLVDETEIEQVHETIVIYCKGNKVIALDKLTGKKAVAKCSPEDEFDFTTGAKLAFDRLMSEQEKESKKPLYSGKVVCVEARNSFVTKGKIYEFKNGRAIDDDGDQFPRFTPVETLGQLNDILWSDFIEVVG